MTKRALCVGINRFTDPELTPLRGAVNDARTLSLMLVRDFGYDPSCVRVLTDAQATKSAVLGGLDAMIASARAGDELVLFVSSYGSEIPDQDGDEEDGRDEVLVVHDHDWSRTVLTDDELARSIARLPDGARLATIWDTCHAGTMEDTASSAYRTRGLDADARVVVTAARFVPGPTGATRAAAKATRTRTATAKKPAKKPSRARRPASAAPAHGAMGSLVHDGFPAVSLSGCADDETSVEASIGGIHEGAFSHCMFDVLRRTRDDLTWSELLARTQAAMTAMHIRQTPQLHLPATLRDAPAFGGRSARVATTSAQRPAAQHAAPASHTAPAVDLASIDRSIVAHESAGRWRDAIAACWQRVAHVHDVAEKLRTIEHVVSIHRVILRDEAAAVQAAREALRVDPAHPEALAYVRGR